jgi:hypothetical protein
VTSKNLYFTILQALLGYNIFYSLFSGDISGVSWCGSWFFPMEKDGGTGFMGSGELECPNQIQGKLTEALWTSIFLSAILLFTYLKGKGQLREFFTGNDPKKKLGNSEYRSLSDNDVEKPSWLRAKYW